ncbi:WbqC family protein [Agriterribacter sp.]|nr:WbqC family protein [Agriterribacter sp.]HRO48436.1 WbqC family protein [Agriterribacter sp.]HRQ18443.1 WbqC family protein [Agriterribacter sp.]
MHFKIEQYERWQKAGFRNRCIIAGANGLINLSIPVEGGRHSNRLIREVRIDNSHRWQMLHWRSVVSAYNRSPWFEYYKDEMASFYHTKYDWLWDWNLVLLQWTIKKLGVEVKIDFTESWQKDYLPGAYLDMRHQVLPKNFTSFAGDCPVYQQVFEDRLGFVPNLSIIDLLFCEGPNAVNLLRQ